MLPRKKRISARQRHPSCEDMLSRLKAGAYGRHVVLRGCYTVSRSLAYPPEQQCVDATVILARRVRRACRQHDDVVHFHGIHAFADFAVSVAWDAELRQCIYVTRGQSEQ